MNNLQKQLGKNFSKATKTYFDHAYVQKNPANRLVQELDLITNQGLTLDLGSGPGTFCHRPSQYNREVINFDLSIQMLKTGIKNNGMVCGDAAFLPFANNTFDQIISNLMIQWPIDKTSIFREIQRILNNNGFFLFTTLIKPSLWQLTTAWKKIDQFEHTLKFCSIEEYHTLCRANGLDIIVTDHWEEKYSFTNIYNLLTHFKLSGTSLPKVSTTHGLGGRNKLKHLQLHYPEMNDSQELLLSYCYLLLVVRKKND